MSDHIITKHLEVIKKFSAARRVSTISPIRCLEMSSNTVFMFDVLFEILFASFSDFFLTNHSLSKYQDCVFVMKLYEKETLFLTYF